MFIYEIINNLNGKRYFGKVDKPGKSIQDRYWEHLKLARLGTGNCLHNAITKHGLENFSIRQVCICRTKESRDIMERHFIKRYKTNRYRHGDLFGYNLTDGGDGRNGFTASDETKMKLSKSLKNRVFTQEHKDRIREATKRQHSNKESREKLVNGILKSFENPETREKMRLKAEKQWKDNKEKMLDACFNIDSRNKRSKSQYKKWEERKEKAND